MAEDLLQDETPLSVGVRLRRAREARGMTVDGVGAAIKLSPRQVEAIEADDYARLTNATYARGFIRNYASLMGLDAAEMLTELDQHQVRATPQLLQQADVGVAMPRQSVHRKWLLPLLAMSVPVIAALALYAWFEFWPSASADAVMADSGVTHGPADEGFAQADDDGGSQSSESLPSLDTAASEAVLPDALPEVVVPHTEAAGTVPLPGQKQLVFTFAEESWVEIRDAQDKIILSDLNRAGSTRTVTTAMPVTLVIGNAQAVKLSVDGQPHDLSPSIKVEVARLRLE